MTTRNAIDVARRCLCLELLVQRLGLEVDVEDPAEEREAIRRKWALRVTDLGLDTELGTSERRLLETAVGALSEDDLDDLDGRASCVVIFLWALGRLDVRPSYAAALDMASLVAAHGLLGSGSIGAANEAARGATLRSESELGDAVSAYERVRGKAREPSDPDKIIAGVFAHHLSWILDPEMPFDEA